MTKQQLKDKTQEIIKYRMELYLQQLDKAIDKMDENLIRKKEDDYFLPQAFFEALHKMNHDEVSQRSYTVSYVRKYNNAVRMFWSEIWSAR